MSSACANCGGQQFLEDPVRGDTICADCGCCLPERLLDEALEKRNFMDSGKDHNRGSELDKYLGLAAQSECKVIVGFPSSTSHLSFKRPSLARERAICSVPRTD